MAIASRMRDSSTLRELGASARARWSAISPRERSLVSVALAVVAVTVAWLVLLRPALRTEAQAPGRIRELRTELARARAQADELASLARQPAAPAAPAGLDSVLKQWLQQQGAQAQVTLLPQGPEIRLQGLPAGALAELARHARSDWGAQVRTAKLALQDSKLSGSIALQLSQPPSGGADAQGQP
jgi:general secretion pathway protein M